MAKSHPGCPLPPWMPQERVPRCPRSTWSHEVTRGAALLGLGEPRGRQKIPQHHHRDGAEVQTTPVSVQGSGCPAFGVGFCVFFSPPKVPAGGRAGPRGAGRGSGRRGSRRWGPSPSLQKCRTINYPSALQKIGSITAGGAIHQPGNVLAEDSQGPAVDIKK